MENKELLDSLNKTKASSITIADSLAESVRLQASLDQASKRCDSENDIKSIKNRILIAYLQCLCLTHISLVTFFGDIGKQHSPDVMPQNAASHLGYSVCTEIFH